MKIVRRALLTTFVAGSLAVPLAAQDLMPVAQQNALVQKYCAVCHTDAARNGGLTLQHFDAGTAAPSLKAMMLSKLTGGVTIRTATDARTDPAAAALVNRTMKTGAVGAAGIPIPDKPTIEAWVHAFATGSAGANEWNIERPDGVTASMASEVPSADNPAQAEIYRVILSCGATENKGTLQVAWSPVARAGTLNVSVDGSPAKSFIVAGDEAMGNNSGLVLHGPAAAMLTGLPLPSESLTISDLFPDQRVMFSFSGLPKDVRREFRSCFPLTK